MSQTQAKAKKPTYYQKVMGGGKHGESKHHSGKQSCHEDDTCEEIRFVEKIRVPVVVKIMKPLCEGDCAGDDTLSTCEVEKFEARIKIPVIAKIKKAKCIGDRCN